MHGSAEAFVKPQPQQDGHHRRKHEKAELIAVGNHFIGSGGVAQIGHYITVVKYMLLAGPKFADHAAQLQAALAGMANDPKEAAM